jgi:hypothetical protein
VVCCGTNVGAEAVCLARSDSPSVWLCGEPLQEAGLLLMVRASGDPLFGMNYKTPKTRLTGTFWEPPTISDKRPFLGG